MKICKDGRVWGQNNKQAGTHLGIAVHRNGKKGKLLKHSWRSGGEFKKGKSHIFFGKKRPEHAEFLRKKYVGSGNPCWRGGRSSYRERIRESQKYKEWRQKVFIRDNFTCQKCFAEGDYLECHHKKPFYKLLDEIENNLPLFNLYDGAMIYTPFWDISNGVTLCKKCHNKTKGYKNRKVSDKNEQ